jgi:hypothetical protein
MSKTVIVRLRSTGYNITGPFKVSDNLGNVLSASIPETDLYIGESFTVVDAATSIVLESLDNCEVVLSISIQELTYAQIYGPNVTSGNTGSLWRHLTNTLINNKYYDKIEPYIIEYPFAYQYHDEILQNVKDYTRAYRYLPIPDGVYNDNAKIQTDNQYFNKVIVYNGQQCSGMLELVKKPLNNLAAYNTYPIYNAESKTILYSKSDSFYQYNTFWNVVIDKEEPLFNITCESLSIDKALNQVNMDYGVRSFKKDPLRAKGLLVRHILDNTSDAHLVSQFVIAPSQISYK